jgi:DNA-binding MarR family transcriptional regulator
MFIVHLMQHKWGAEAPFPGYKTIAKRMRVSDKTARRLAKSLEDKKYLVREVREATTNRFHLTKLMAALVGLKKATTPSKSSRKTEKGS